MTDNDEIQTIKYSEDYHIPLMPEIMKKSFEAIRNPAMAPALLAKLIQEDASISSKIINLLNSPYYGHMHNVTSVGKAVLSLGTMKIKNLIMCLSLKQMMCVSGSRSLWEHNIKCAIAAQTLAKEYNLINPDDAYAMGMLHDVGKILLNLENSVKYSKVDYLVNKRNIDVMNAEEAQFGTNHCVLGELMLKKWQMPIILSNCIKYHHDPLRASLPPVCGILYAANRLIQPTIQAPFFDKDIMDKLNFTILDPIVLRETILAKANLFLKELNALY